MNKILTFFAAQIALQRQSLFLWSPVCLGAGIMTYFNFDTMVDWPILSGAVFFAILAVSKSVHGYAKTGHNRWLFAVLISLIAALFVAGFSVAQYRTQSLSTPILKKDLSPITIQGTIEKLVRLDGGKAKRVILNDIKGIDGHVPIARARLKTYHFKGDDWNIGDRVEVRAKLIAPSQPVMPNGFDFSRKAYFERLGAVGYTMGNAVLISQGVSNTGQIQVIRDRIGRNVYTAMNLENAGIAQALLTGERAGIAKDDTEALRTSGLAHLLAISGLHIGLVAGCVFFFVRLFLACIPNMALYHPIKKYAAACAIVIAFTYMVLAGATVPTVRAFIMTSLVLLAVILDRSALNMRLVALAAIIVMVTTPEAITWPSFVLSFAAVTGLIAFYQGVGRKWLVNANAYRPLWRPIYYLAGIIATTVIATLATAPFSVMFFNRFAVYSVIANIGAMPLMAFIVMPFGLLAMLLSPFGLDAHIWFIMEWGIAQITDIAHAVSNYKGADLHLPSFGLIDTILISVGFLMLVLWRGVLRWCGAVAIIIAFMIPHINTPQKIFISEKMNAILIVDKSEDNLFLLGKMNSYLKRNWLGSMGYNVDVDILNYNRGDKIDISNGYCDDFICRLNFNGVKVSVLNNPISLKHACDGADILIAKIPVQGWYCEDVFVIDRFDVWRSGATTITFRNGGYDVETVK